MVRQRRCLPTMYAKRTVANPPITDGDMRWDSGWLWGGFGVVGYLTRDVPR